MAEAAGEPHGESMQDWFADQVQASEATKAGMRAMLSRLHVSGIIVGQNDGHRYTVLNGRQFTITDKGINHPGQIEILFINEEEETTPPLTGSIEQIRDTIIAQYSVSNPGLEGAPAPTTVREAAAAHDQEARTAQLIPK